jgi:hypothetical protein
VTFDLPVYLPFYARNLLVEVPLVLLLLGRSCGWYRTTAVVVLANTLTHPTLYFVLPRLLPSLGVAFIAGEVLALVIEWALYDRVLHPEVRWMALTAAAGANLASLGVGILLH